MPDPGNRWAALVAAVLGGLGLLVIGRVLWLGIPALGASWQADLDVVWQTLGMGGVALLLSLSIGTGLAFLTTQARLGRGADLLISSAYFIPPFIGATAWLAALGPANVLTGKALLNLYSPAGIVLAWVTHYAPLAYLLVRAGLTAQGDTLNLAGRIHGMRARRVFRFITLPLLWPSLWGAALLIGLSLLGNFGVPAVLGFPEKIYTLATLSYARLMNPTLADPLAAAAAAAWLLLTVSLPFLLFPAPRAYAGGVHLPLPVHPAMKRLAWTCALLWFGVSFLLPVSSIALLSLKPAYTAGWTLEHFTAVLGLNIVRRGLLTSLMLAAITALLCTGLGLWLARHLSGHPAGRGLTRLLTLPYFLPGTLLALGLIVVFTRSPLYATPLLLLLAYLLRFLTPGVEAAQTALTPQQRQMEFAGRVHGLSAFSTLRHLALPLLRPQLLYAITIITPLVLSEITLSALLYAPGAETAGVGVLNLLAEGNMRGAAALSCLLLLLTLPLTLMSRRPHP